MKSILERSFRYVNSAETDIAATFRRIRRELKEQERARAAVAAEAALKVKPIKQGGKA